MYIDEKTELFLDNMIDNMLIEIRKGENEW